MTKICDVCGDKGLARNFGAITCDSCKSFFRRTALKNQLICASNGKCNINVMTRGLCRKCRLKKCFAVGMKTELIQSNEQKKCKKILIKEKLNNSKHKPSDKSNNCDDFSPNNSQNNSIISDTTIDENSLFDLLNINLFNINDIEKESIVSKNNKSEKSNAMPVNEKKRHELSVIPVFKTISDYNGINQLESKRIAELLNASNNIFQYPLQSNAIIHRIKDMDEFANKFQDYSETSIRLIIQFTKSLNSFNNICADDKYALMKYGGKDLVLIRFLKHYDRESHSLITPIDRDNSVQFDLDSNNNCIYIYCKDIYY
ncbi:unnamed protein product, partial [Medioppia subpectinata]